MSVSVRERLYACVLHVGLIVCEMDIRLTVGWLAVWLCRLFGLKGNTIWLPFSPILVSFCGKMKSFVHFLPFFVYDELSEFFTFILNIGECD